MPVSAGSPRDRQYRRALEAQGVAGVLGRLPPAGQDRIYAGNGQVPSYLWQMALAPRGYPAGALENRFLTENLVVSTLVGQDRIYAGNGKVATYQWQQALPTPARVPPLENRTLLEALVTSTLRGQDTISGAPGQAPDYEWLVPKGYPYPLANRTHLGWDVTDTLAGQDILYGVPGQVGDYEWVVPRGSIPAIVLRTHVNWDVTDTLVGQDRMYAGPGQVPVYDLSLPVAVTARPKQDRARLLDFFVNLLTSTLATVQATLPEGLRGLIWPDAPWAPWLSRLTSHAVAQRAQTDVRDAGLLRHLAGQDTIYGAPGQAPVYDLSLPVAVTTRPKQDRSRLLDFFVNLLTSTFTTIQPTLPEGLRGLTWPDAPWVPWLSRQAGHATARRAQTDVKDSGVLRHLAGQDTLYGAPGQVPEYDWQTGLTPRGAPERPDNRSWLHSLVRFVIGQDRFYGAPGQVPGYDYPNPRAYPPRPTRRDEPNQTLVPLTVPEAPPAEGLRGRVWPDFIILPLLRTLRVAMRAQEDVTPARPVRHLIGQDTLYSAPGQVPEYDWQTALPTPPAPRASTLRGHIDDGAARRVLTGQDRVYGAPGQAPVYDWQTKPPPLGVLPRARAILRSLWEVVGNGFHTVLSPPPPVFRGRVRGGDRMRNSVKAGDAATGSVTGGDESTSAMQASDD